MKTNIFITGLCATNNTFESYGLLNYLGGAEAHLLFRGVTNLKYRSLDAISRQNRIRYDSPSFSGFSFAASLDNGDENEVAVRYKGKVAGGKLDARFGNADKADYTGGSIAYRHDSGFGVSYSNAEKGANDSDWLMVGYTFGKSTITYGIPTGYLRDRQLQ